MATTKQQKLDAFARQQGYKNYYDLRKARAQAQGYSSLKDQLLSRRTGTGLKGSDLSNPKYLSKQPKKVERLPPPPPPRNEASISDLIDRTLRIETASSKTRIQSLDPLQRILDKISFMHQREAMLLGVQSKISHDPRFELSGKRRSENTEEIDAILAAMGRNSLDFFDLQKGPLGLIYQDSALAANPAYGLGRKDASILQKIAELGQQNITEAAQFARVDSRRFMKHVLDKRKGISPAQWAKRNEIRAVIYANGQRHGFASYAELSMRAAAQRAQNLAIAQASDAQWFDVTDGNGCGWTFHDDGDVANGTTRSLEEVSEFPIAHPNCQRSISPNFDMGPKGKQRSELSKLLELGVKAQVGSLAADLAAGGVQALLTNRGVQAKILEISSRFVPGAWETRIKTFLQAEKLTPVPEGTIDLTAARLSKESAEAALADVQYDIAEGSASTEKVRKFIGVEGKAEELPKAVGDEFNNFIEYRDRKQKAKLSLEEAFRTDQLEQLAFQFMGEKFGPVGNKFARFTFPKVGFGDKVGAARFSTEPNRLINATITKTQRGIVNHLGFNKHGLFRAGITRDAETKLWTPNFRVVPRGPIRLSAKINRSKGRTLIIENLGPGRGGALNVAREGRFSEVVRLTTDELFQVNSLDTGDTIKLGNYLYEKLGPDEVLQGRGRLTSISWEARLITKTPVNFSASFNFNLRKLGIHNWQDIRNLSLQDFRKLGFGDLKIVSLAAEVRAGGAGPLAIAKTFRLPWEDAQKLWEMTSKFVETNGIKMPPVPEGHVRLFRGEGPRVDPSKLAPDHRRVVGRMFTNLEDYAMNYHEEGGSLLYVDVPEEISFRSNLAGGGVRDGVWVDVFPDILEFSTHPLFGLFRQKDEWLLPREWADKAIKVPNPSDSAKKIIEGIKNQITDVLARRRRNKFIAIYGEDVEKNALDAARIKRLTPFLEENSFLDYERRASYRGKFVMRGLDGDKGVIKSSGPSYVTVQWEFAEKVSYQWETVNDHVKLFKPGFKDVNVFFDPGAPGG